MSSLDAAARLERTPRSDAEGRLGSMLAVLLTAVFMTTADNSIVNVGVPSVRSGLGASGGELELVVSGYVLAYGVLLVTGARLGDLLGYRRVFLAGVACFTVASLACGLAATPETLIASRLVQGAGAALMVPQVLSAIQLHFGGAARVRAMGLYSAALAGGAAAGQSLGGALVSANLFGSQWRPIFLINVPVGVALLAAGGRGLPMDEGRGTRRLDFSGVATLSSAIALLAVPLMLGRDAGWPAWVWVCLALSAPVFFLFVSVERRLQRRGGDPLLRLSVLTRPTVSWGLLAQAAATTTYAGLLFTLAVYLQEGLHRTPLYSGLVLLSWVAGFGLAGVLVRHLPRRLPLAPAALLLLALCYASAAAIGGARSLDGFVLVGLLGLGGLGMGAGFTALVAQLADAVPVEHASDLSGAVTTTSELAGVLGVALFGTLYLAQADAPERAFALVLGAFALTALLAAAAAWKASASWEPMTALSRS